MWENHQQGIEPRSYRRRPGALTFDLTGQAGEFARDIVRYSAIFPDTFRYFSINSDIFRQFAMLRENRSGLRVDRVSSIFSRNLPVLVEIETVEIFLEICRSFRAPVVSRSVPGPGLGKCWPFGPFWQVLRAKVPCCSNILGAKAEI